MHTYTIIMTEACDLGWVRLQTKTTGLDTSQLLHSVQPCTKTPIPNPLCLMFVSKTLTNRVLPEFPLLVPFIVLLPLSVSALAY